MKSSTSALAIVILLSLSALTVNGQLLPSQTSSITGYFASEHIKIKLRSISSNEPYKASLNSANTPNPFGVGSVSAQSFNKGKLGRLYCWDAQGNLRSSYLFIDISGRNKRGLKLVFPKHRLMVDTRNKVIF